MAKWSLNRDVSKIIEAGFSACAYIRSLRSIQLTEFLCLFKDGDYHVLHHNQPAMGNEYNLAVSFNATVI